MSKLMIKLSSAEPVKLLKSDEVRTFKGVANSGRPFSYGSHGMVIDLSDIKYKESVPVLAEHNPQKMAGVCRLSVSPDGLIAEGSLLSNQYGSEIAEAADQGFPWEMSVYAQAGSYEELQAGASVEVNGNIVNGPATILRQCVIREVSFTAVGVDSETSAVVLSDGTPFNPVNVELSMTKEEQAQFDALKAEVEQLKTEKAEAEGKLAEALKQGKKANVKAKLSAAGFKETAEGWDGLSQATVNVLLSAADADVDAMIADLKPSHLGAIPDALLSDGQMPSEQEQSQSGVKFSVSTLKGGLSV